MKLYTYISAKTLCDCSPKAAARTTPTRRFARSLNVNQG